MIQLNNKTIAEKTGISTGEVICGQRPNDGEILMGQAACRSKRPQEISACQVTTVELSTQRGDTVPIQPPEIAQGELPNVCLTVIY